MPRNRILASNIANPSVSTALREYAGERGAILARLTSAFKADPRIRAALLWGSFMREEQDDLSDLDIWLFVSDDRMNEVGSALAAYCASAGTLVTVGESPHNAPPRGGYCGAMLAGSHGLHHLDIYWQPVSMCSHPAAPRLASGFDWQTAQPIELPASAILFNRMLGRAGSAEPMSHRKFEEGNDNKLSFIWLMTSIAAKYLARDPASDMSLLRYAKPTFEEAVAELGLESEIGEVDWSTPSEPPAKVELLRRIVAKTTLIEEIYRCQGQLISPEANPCLIRYLDLVEGLVRHKDLDIRKV